MAETKEIYLGEFNLGSVDRIQLLIDKDLVDWSGIDSATIVFEAPDRSTQHTRSMTLGDDATGTWYYDTVTTEWDAGGVGDWTANVRVVAGGVPKRYPFEISFRVNDHP